ncbi:MAG TPA: hypothetical protein VLJ57_22680 [Burkholderiaceae bacterium]|nr:hypothetical protein [Burkholderiaceae bacterium]
MILTGLGQSEMLDVLFSAPEPRTLDEAMPVTRRRGKRSDAGKPRAEGRKS